MQRVLWFATLTAAGVVIGKVSGILREVVVSAHFGLSSELDAYFVAFTVPTIINNIVAGSAISSAIIPTFAQYLARGERNEFWRVASMVTNVILIVTGALTLLAMLLPAPIIALVGAGFPAETQTIASTLLVIMMPTLMLGALLNMLMAMLNALDRFAAPALIFLALNLGIIVTVIVLAPIIGVAAVAWGFLIGVALQVIIQLIELRAEHPRFFWRIDWRHPALREVLRAFVPITLLSIVAQINYVVDKTMATGLPAGSVGALYYADSILGLFYLVGNSLAIGVFPSLSRLAAIDDLDNTAHTVTTALRLVIFILAPITGLLIPFASPVVGVILGRGKFDASAVDLTAQALAMYAIGLIALAALYILQRAFYAVRNSTTPFVIGVGVMALHIVLNLALMPSMQHAGIALSASISNITGVVVLVVLLARRVPKIGLNHLARYVVQCGGLAILTTGIVAFAFAATRLDTATLIARLIGVAFALIGGGLYLGAAFILRIPESQMLFNFALGFLRRTKSESPL